MSDKSRKALMDRKSHDLFMKHGKLSPQLLMRKLKITYDMAAEITEQFECKVIFLNKENVKKNQNLILNEHKVNYQTYSHPVPDPVIV